MKANRKFVQADEAVSPVIAVILMVAITVVLAATVFVLVSDIGGQSTTAPAFSLRADQALDRVIVDSATQRADWNRLAISANVDNTTEWSLNAATTGAGTNDGVVTAAQQPVTLAGANPMGAGEFIEFCGTTAAVNDVVYTLTDTNANQQMGTWTFLTVAAC